MMQEQNTSLEKQRPAQQEEHTEQQAEPVARQLFRCANCEIDFFWSPTVSLDKIYCCTGCAAGGPCNCDYSLYRSVTIMGVIHYEQS